ncbi:amidohydrolase [Fulvivirga maritima]|uniref:amidohydrolase n=1 Tax=Fulvivirga maritima TaxID=2904247 RepID=UPI001F34842D|nr:amidohydrolase [Fulvivirga maritima]UII28591.1 amidohydrolase [Fulvivirga maritima]
MQDLKVSIIQSSLHWQNTSANLAMFEEKIWQIEESTDLIVLPEMFTTGFSMEAEKLAEPMNFTTFRWMRQMAEQTKACICGSYIVKENNNYYNRLIWMTPSGEYQTYDKRHLFRMANEHDHYSAGSKRLVVSLKGWRICPLVCYDLRFPVFSRNISAEGEFEYDLAIYVANWPQARVSAWDALLQARAIENLCYTIGVNRTGEDGKGISYNGSSAIISPKGEKLYHRLDDEAIYTTSLNGEELLRFREKFPAQLDADKFSIN